METATKTTRCHASCPAWLRAALAVNRLCADIENRVQSLAVSLPDDSESDSFAERAENYYQKRPQLVALLHDLHHRYLYLADRYSLSLHRHRRRGSSVSSDMDVDVDSASSDADSTLSFQPLSVHPPADFAIANATSDLDMIVVELVLASVERDMLESEQVDTDRRLAESSRKIEIQGSLVEVLEAERMVLLGENARLGFLAASAEEKARAVAAELGYMRRRAADLAGVVVKLREDHRVCLLGRKIEGLQAQIYGLERRNREYLEAMARREKEKREAQSEADLLREENCRLREEAEAAARGARRRSWWDRVRKLEWAQSPYAIHVKDAKAPKGCFL
ncbi:kinase-interacting family protein-like [Curcuma longa]|uniref:kinase-interacting family protein-like n=1 Tax=Curcuma longa TaxID=136217 RepID=UPI003D9E2AC2